MVVGSINITSAWVSGKGFVLWDNSGWINSNNLKYQLFARHKHSYYGTFIDTVSYRGQQVVFLSPLTALDFFTTQTWSGETNWCWGRQITRMMEIAPHLKKALVNGHWKPDFRKWQQGRRGWLVEWDGNLDGSDAEAEVSFVCEWASLIINELIEVHPEISQAWQKVLFSYPILTSDWGRPHLLISDEETWLEKAGWKQDLTPFTVCLELAEPEENSSSWRLNVMLKDKKDPNIVAVWGSGESDLAVEMPPEWRHFGSRVEREIKGWIGVLPWLEETTGELMENFAGLRRKLSEDEAWDFLHDGAIRLAQAGHTVFLPRWWEEIKMLLPRLKIKTHSSVGSWQESRLGLNQIIQFDWNLAVGGLELSEKEFRQVVEKKRRLIKIRGHWIQLDPVFLKKARQFMGKKDSASLGKILHLSLLTPDVPPVAKQDLDGKEALRIEVELGGQLAQMVEQLHNLSQIPLLEPAASFRGTLRKYQQTGASWLLFLRRFGLGGCLADDMGLGKTIQWIAYLLKVKESENPVVPSLLICPTSVLGNWQKELARFAPDLRVQLHYGPQRVKGPNFLQSVKDVDLVITSYNLAHIDEEELSQVEWDCICLDEAQNIKNAYTKQAAAVKRFRCDHRIVMTGTPMENRLTELWSLFDFINPGYLGSSGEFSRKFVNVIEKKGDAQDIERVQKLIRPFLLRRVKSDPTIELDLPEKQEQKEYVPLTVEQASIYEGILQDLFERLEKSDGMARRGLILATLSRLKQVCAHPALLLKEDQPDNISGRSRKVERLLEMIADLRQQGDSCLIFTQFIRMGRLLQEVLMEELGEQSYFLHGGTPKKNRDEMISRFQNLNAGDNFNVFILSLKAGGLGLNLTAANHVFHYDRWWNPAVENQATDRSHRIGQTRHVMVHKFISLGTMEERIDETLERKSNLSEKIVGGSEAWVTEISTAELRELFTLRKEWIGL